VKIQLRNQSRLRMPTPLGERKAAFGTTAIAMAARIAGVPSSGHVSKDFHEPRRAHHLRSQEWKDGRQGKPEATEDGWTSSLMTP